GQPQIATNPWHGEYFNGRDLYPTTNDTPDKTRDDSTINFNWGAGGSLGPFERWSQIFAVRWTKTDTFAGGIYSFDIDHDDGMRVYIDDQKIFDDWKASDRQVLQQHISPGIHTVKVE